MGGMDIEIVTPPVAESFIDDGLVEITKAISALAPDRVSHGVLGGEFGYGAHWDNHLFTMRPFYWGDCDCGWMEIEDYDDPHDAPCYQVELEREQRAAGVHWEQKHKMAYTSMRAIEDEIYERLTAKYGLSMYGCAVHCTCGRKDRYEAWFAANKLGSGESGHADNCAVILPNFHYKPTGLKIEWYKWIGRSMEFDPAPPTAAEWADIMLRCLSSIA